MSRWNNHSIFFHLSTLIKFIYSEKATKFCEISTLLLSYVVPVKSKVEIPQNFVAFSESMKWSLWTLPSVAEVASDGGVSLSIAVLKALTISIDADNGKNNASVSSSKPMEKSDSNAPLATNRNGQY